MAPVVRFFDAVAAATGNRVIVLAQEPLSRLLAPSLARMIGLLPQARQRIVDAQSRIVAALDAGDAETARNWMRRHIIDFRRGYDLAKLDLGEAVPLTGDALAPAGQ